MSSKTVLRLSERSMAPNAVAELSSIPVLAREELVGIWEATYRRQPPKGISRRLLEYSASYTSQVKLSGGIRPGLVRDLSRSVDPRTGKAAGRTAPKKASKLPTGTRLVREWHGQTHTVEVTEHGFTYDGKCYRSLSKIARLITGARWSGPRFFGT